ncbi:pilus assembly protein [Hyphomicrobium sp. LHD-15]|uniref:TadE/TadG family type IV pilus assembly protein n=1 Tax=Hyphomicrobium sp. LHD-15 TaxID=3072142 RepID=UPI00280C8572|nr:pilus assembly protein [Hyphomicrobium sp. LHD-15]MDQ8700249.1 pilus assembly protein [Hyphomicrobium sp. LHD-15]
MTSRQSVEAGACSMPVASTKRAIARVGHAVSKFGADIRGIAAVEFGFIAPIMLLFLLGTIELTRAIAIDQRFDHLTSAIADLVAREDRLTADDVKAIYDIAGEMMSPYDANDLKISIIPVMSSASNAENTRVYPATTNRPSFNGGAQPARCQAYSLTKGVLSKNESVIVVEATYKFKPMFAGYLMNTSDWTSKAFAKPRKGLCVVFDDNCLSSCFS